MGVSLSNMTDLVNSQFNMVTISLMLGGMMGLSYDAIRCFRRMVSHNLFFLSVEDFLYWLIWTVIVLDAICGYNYGELRLYIFVAMTLGFVIYRGTIGWALMRLFHYIWCPVKKTIQKIKNCLKKQKKNSRI